MVGRGASALRRTNTVVAALSVLGAAFVLACASCARDFARGRTFVFIARLCVADLGFAVFALMGDRGSGRDVRSPSTACVLQGMGIQAFGVAEAFWATAVSREVRDAVTRRRSVASSAEIRRRVMAYDVQIWGIVVALALIPLATRTYGDSQLGRCHIRRSADADGGAKAIRFAVYYLPIWLCVVYNLVCWWDIARAMRGARALERALGTDPRARAATTRLLTFARRLALYPAVQVCTNVPGTVMRLIDLLTSSRYSPPPWLMVSHVAAKTSQGMLHAIVFVYAHPARRDLIISFARSMGVARFLPMTWGVDSTGFRAADAQAGGQLVDDVDFVSEGEEDTDDGFVVLSNSTDAGEDRDGVNRKLSVEEDEDIMTHDLRPVVSQPNIEMSAMLIDDVRSDDA